MLRAGFGSVVLCAVALGCTRPAPAPVPAEAAPMQGLTALVGSLEGLGEDLLAGRDSDDPLLRVDVRPEGLSDTDALVFAGLEFELAYHRDGPVVYYLRTFAFLHEGALRFHSVTGEVMSGPLFVTAVRLDHIPPSLGMLADAARELSAAVSSGALQDQLTTDADLAGWPADLREDLKEEPAVQLAALSEAEGQLRSLSYDHISVRIDDFAYLAMDAEGRAVGLVKGHQRMDLEGGVVAVELKTRALP